MRVRSQFAWDEHAGRWVWSALVEEGQGELARMLESVRITEPRDTRCLARMLAEVALADGVVAPAESAFFQSFTGQDVAGIKGALGAGELTAEELSETTPFLREPMLGLAWALAFTDQDLAPSEEARLARFAQGLGIAPERAALLRSHAREYVVEEMLSEAYAERAPSATVRAEVAAAARQLGVATADYDDIERRTQRLRGLAD
ncbi:MAG: TerB family tellurite resistance protein [Deltaproteobacteria bacterium]|nr:TerB family tellurite resistance protein [Deltaproteobacteria bacterium]